MSISGLDRLEKSIENFKLSLKPEDHHTLKNYPDPSAEDVANFVKDLDAKLQQKQKRRKTLQSSPFTTFIRSMQQFSSIVDTCVQSNPEIAALVWGGMKFVLLTFSNYLKYLEEIVDMCDQMGRLCPQFERFSKLFPKHKELQSAICEFYAIIVDFFREALLFLYSSVFKQLAVATFRPFEEKFGGILKSLDLAKETIDKEITLSSEQELHVDRLNNAQLRTDVQDLCHWTRTHHQYYQDRRIQVSEEARRSKRERILRNISVYPYYSDFTNNLHKRFENSGMWIYDTPEYKSWFDSTKSVGLWYHAIPGFGKSVLTAGVIDSILEMSRTSRNERHYVAYFFCTYKNASSLLAQTILSSLLHQMLYYSHNLPKSILDDLESRFEDKARSSRVLLSDIQRFLGDILQNNQANNYIVIDGLDECIDKERGTVLRALKKLLEDAPQSLKILISSRGSQDMIRALQSFQQFDLKGSNQNDIEAFISRRLQDKELEGQLPELPGDIFDKVKSFLIENAKGLFIWVDLQIEEICKEARPEDIEAVLPTLPKDLDELYDRILSRIARLRRPDVAREIFTWVAYAIRPLTLEELKEATSLWNIELKTWEALHKAAAVDESKWLQNCESLVVVNGPSQTVEFAHSTIKEFLESSKPSDTSFKLEQFPSHYRLGNACVRYFGLQEITGTENQTITVSKQSISALARASVKKTQDDTSWANWMAWKVYQYTPGFTSVSSASATSTALVKVSDPMIVTTQKQTFKSLLQTYPLLEYATSSWVFHFVGVDFAAGGHLTMDRPVVYNLLFKGFSTIRFPWQTYFTPESLTLKEKTLQLLDWALDNKVDFIFDLVCDYHDSVEPHHLDLFMEFWLSPPQKNDDETNFKRVCFRDTFAGDELWNHITRVIRNYIKVLKKLGGILSQQPNYLFLMLRSACSRSDKLLFDRLVQILELFPRITRSLRTAGYYADGLQFISSKYLSSTDYKALVEIAISYDSLEILRSLQDNKYNEFIQTFSTEAKFILLHSVARVGKAQYFEVLMSRYAGGLAGTHPDYQSLIQRVSEIGEAKMVNMCLPHQSSMRLRSKKDPLYPIQIAAKYNHLNVIKAMKQRLFLDENDVDLVAPRAMNTALAYAIKNGNAEMVRILLDAGANLTLKPKSFDRYSIDSEENGYPCYQFAMNPNLDVFDILLTYKRRTAFLETLAAVPSLVLYDETRDKFSEFLKSVGPSRMSPEDFCLFTGEAPP
ncbi:hypothetical protein TWF225_006762 [Orbilia oligospora]|nr:hypothetical protein TWF225_006762 [Orbilia oligospora]KAF3233773.1 hypothetical protein TWF128_002885 [Orbilia oligospora]KAF3237480.1 hypothetical protein TWF217_002104 [Orbilia oligospora]KAF3279981.1 hypothetical protein TWF132_011996 [Orbilia oligospora]